MSDVLHRATSGIRQRPLLGIGYVLLATLAFAVTDILTKHLAMHHAVSMLMAVRFSVSLLLLAVVMGPQRGAGLWHVERPWLVVARGLCLTLAGVCVAQALRTMPVGEAVTIVYVSPFLVMILATPLLGETVKPAAWIGAALGFIGVLCIARPGSGLDHVGVLWAIGCASFATIYSLLTRFLAAREDNIAMLFVGTAVGCVVLCALAVTTGAGLVVSRLDLGLMALLGMLSTLGHFLFTAANRYAPALMIAPVSYVHLLWAGGLSWLVFGHVPNAWSLMGMALIFTAGAGVAIGASLGTRQ